ncbi:hypothetical protein [Streptomyces sp. NPDC060198]|uniref:hypothetical protein n=1 Tax=Streptomyces sp. NPDC060198 TaxID=3347070 RepID=UPI00365D3BCF
MGVENTVLGVIVAVIGGVSMILVARVSTPRPAPAPEQPNEDEPPPGLQVSPEIWEYFSGRFDRLEADVAHLTAVVETKKIEVSALEKLLRSAMRIVRRQQRRLRAHGDRPEDVPLELIPYSID